MVSYSSILAWRIPMEIGARWATVHRSRTRLKQISTHADWIICVVLTVHSYIISLFGRVSNISLALF